MKTSDAILLGAVVVVAFYLFRRRAPIATVTTSETYSLPILDAMALDINSGLYTLPMPIFSEGVSQGIPL